MFMKRTHSLILCAFILGLCHAHIKLETPPRLRRVDIVQGIYNIEGTGDLEPNRAEEESTESKLEDMNFLLRTMEMNIRGRANQMEPLLYQHPAHTVEAREDYGEDSITHRPFVTLGEFAKELNLNSVDVDYLMDEDYPKGYPTAEDLIIATGGDFAKALENIDLKMLKKMDEEYDDLKHSNVFQKMEFELFSKKISRKKQTTDKEM